MLCTSTVFHTVLTESSLDDVSCSISLYYHTTFDQFSIILIFITVGTVLLYNAETWTTRRALERRIDDVYTRLLRKALDVPWQLHLTMVWYSRV